MKKIMMIAVMAIVALGVHSKTINLSKLTDNYKAQDGDVLTGTLPDYISLIIADGARITFNNMTIQASIPYQERPAVTCLGGATITLKGYNSLAGGCSWFACLQLNGEDKRVTINGDGYLKVTATGYGPAIGPGYPKYDCGVISIEGGTIEAYGGTHDGMGAPAIGACRNGTCDGINIKNCTVTAYGGLYSAGIGKCYIMNPERENCNCGVITIENATVKAYGGEKGAGIGGGMNTPGCETRIYEGSNVFAQGGKYGAGIGGGIDAGGGPLWIQGGHVEAYGGTDAAGIGGGESGNSGDIVINGGEVYAYGNGWGVGIGAGEDGDVAADWSSISINGGFIRAEGGEDIGRAIGGEDEEDYNVNVLSFGPCMYAYTPLGTGFPDVPFYNYERNSNLQRCRIVVIKPCEHGGQTLSYAYINEYKHRFICKWCGIVEENHTGKHSCTKCNYNETPHYVHYYEMVYDNQSRQYKYKEVASEAYKDNLVLPALSSPVPKDMVFAGWVNDFPDDYYDDGMFMGYESLYFPGYQFTSEEEDVYFKACYVDQTLNLSNAGVEKTAFDGVVMTGTLESYKHPVKITIAKDATVTLRNVNIIGLNDADFNWAGITCEGNATIILEGENTVKGFYEDYPGIYVPQNCTLTIKSETAGTGSLDASSNGFGAGIGSGYGSNVPTAGNITIKGGIITATGGKYAAGIGSSHHNSCGNILISGGTVNATGGEYAAGIGSGWGGNNEGDNSICGTITITNGVSSVTATKGNEAPNSIGAGLNGTCGNVAVGSMTGAKSRSPYNYLVLQDEADNSARISAFYNKVCDVTLYRRTLYMNGKWNLICLPFDLEDYRRKPLQYPSEVKRLIGACFDNGTLTLEFCSGYVYAPKAGLPYLMQWKKPDGYDENPADYDIVNPVFEEVTITATAPTEVTPIGSDEVETLIVSDGSVTFKGSFGPQDISGIAGDKTKLYFDDGNTLFWPNGEMSINAFRAYMQLNGGLDASKLNAIVMNFYGDSNPIVELMDGMTDFSILSAFGEQEVDARLMDRELSAVQKANGTWQSRAYTVCLPFYADLLNAGCDFNIYSKAEITSRGELLFTQEMLPFLYPGNAYLIVVNKGTLRLQGDGVTLVAEADEADDDENGVLLNYKENQIAGHWLGSLKTIGHDEAVSRKAFTLAGDGSFQRITDRNRQEVVPAFRAMFCATDLMTADKLNTKYQLGSNGEEEEDRSLPAPESYDADNATATAISPVIHTIDLDGTERWFDLSGRQLSGKPTKKGVYIHRGKKQVVK